MTPWKGTAISSQWKRKARKDSKATIPWVKTRAIGGAMIAYHNPVFYANHFPQ